jgi:hypothetical protein
MCQGSLVSIVTTGFTSRAKIGFGVHPAFYPTAVLFSWGKATGEWIRHSPLSDVEIPVPFMPLKFIKHISGFTLSFKAKSGFL